MDEHESGHLFIVILVFGDGRYGHSPWKLDLEVGSTTKVGSLCLGGLLRKNSNV